MSIGNLSSIFNIFKGSSSSQDREQVFHETLLMTLARASHADSHVAPVEVETIRSVIKKVTGREVEASEVRIAAGSELYESAPLETCLARVRDSLDIDSRVAIVRSLAEVIKSDVKVTAAEVSFFNKVAEALRISPAELAGLIP